MKTPIKIFITGGIVLCLAFVFFFYGFLNSKGITKTEASLIQIYKELYGAKQISVNGELSISTEPEKAKFHLYIDNQKGEYTLTSKINNKMQDGDIKKDGKYYSYYGENWHESGNYDDIGQYLNSSYKTIIARNLLDSLTNINSENPKEITIDPIDRTIKINNVKIFSELMIMMGGGSFTSDYGAPKEKVNITIHKGMMNQIEMIVIEIESMEIEGTTLSGVLELKVNQPEEIILPENISPNTNYSPVYDMMPVTQ